MLDDGNDLARRKPVRRTVAERSAIVAETYRPGATVAGVARRHGIVASQLSSWRTIAKGKTDQDKRRGSGFAEITVEANDLHVRFDGIEVVCGAVVIRLPKSTTPKRVADIARHVARGAGRVIYPSQAVRIVIATKPVDFRKGHDGLAALTERELGLDPHSGIMVVFRAKRGDRIKVLLWDGSGLVLCYKRLEHGKFARPKVQDGMMRLTKAQFEALFEGLDWRRVMARRTRRPGAIE